MNWGKPNRMNRHSYSWSKMQCEWETGCKNRKQKMNWLRLRHWLISSRQSGIEKRGEDYWPSTRASKPRYGAALSHGKATWHQMKQALLHMRQMTSSFGIQSWTDMSTKSCTSKLFRHRTLLELVTKVSLPTLVVDFYRMEKGLAQLRRRWKN